MRKLSYYQTRGVQVMIFVICLFFAVGTPVYAFNSLRNIISSVKGGNGANHTIQFVASGQIATSTISVNFQNVVSSTNSISYEYVRLLYGISGSEVEYPVSLAAGDGIWGASINAGVKTLTLSYPTANGTPINQGQSVIIIIGSDPTPEFPVSTSSIVLPTINNQNQLIAQQQQQQEVVVVEERVPVQEVNPINPQNQNRDAPPNQIVIDFQRARQFILEQLQRIRNVITGGGSIAAPVGAPVIAREGALVIPPPSEPGAPGSERLLSETPEQSVLVLPSEKSVNVNPAEESTVSLRREDGAGLDVFLPQQLTLGQGSQARTAVPREGSLENVYTVDVKPVTIEQAKSWTTLQPPAGITVAPAQVYIVTAYAQNENIVTPIQSFLNPVSYVFRFTEEEIQGIDKKEMSGYSWDGTTFKKERSVLNFENNSITVTAGHATVFLLAGPRTSVQSRVAVQSSVSLVPVQSNVELGDFGIMKEGDATASYQSSRDITVTPNTRLALCIPRDVFMKYPKKLTLSLADTATLLTYAGESKCYGGTILSPPTPGTRQMTLRIIYLDDQVQTVNFRVAVLPDFQVRLISLVAPSVETIRKNVEVVNKQIADTVSQTQPALQTTAIAVGPAAAALNPGLLSNSINWYHYLNHFISAVLSALGLRKRRRPWGVVYDAITKNPIDLAIIRLFEAAGNKLIETQVTDKQGRFSFLVKPGTYALAVLKLPYIYPSAIVMGALDGDYRHVYHHETITIKSDEEIIELSIPLDPPHPDQIKKQDTPVHSFSRLFTKYSSISLFVSMSISIILAYYAPTTMNVVLLLANSMFVTVRALRLSGKEKPWGTVFDALSFEPIPLAAIGIVDAKEGKLLRTRLSDYEGRFGFLAPQGEYLFTVSKEHYQFPPEHAVKTKKFRNIYLGGKVAIKKNNGYVKTDIPMEQKDAANSQSVQEPQTLVEKAPPPKKRVSTRKNI